jgi:hypothetical protein
MLDRSKVKKYSFVSIFIVTLLASFNTVAVGHGCYGECQALFKSASLGSPLIGLFYLIAPVFGVVMLLGKKAKKTEASRPMQSQRTGRIFYLLAGISALIIVLIELTRN